MDYIFLKHIITTYTVRILVTIVSLIIMGWGCSGGKKADTLTDNTEEAQANSVGNARAWKCGEYRGNVIAMLKDNGTLIVRGTGVMADYNTSGLPALTVPWHNVKDSIINVVIEYGVTSIGVRAFRDLTNLTSVTISNGVEKIGDGAFLNCPSLTSVTIPNSVTYIGLEAFGSTGLTSVTVPESVTIIGAGAFGNCRNLMSVTIPNSVKYLGELAFMGTNLTSVTIPSSVTSIGDGVFAHCTSLTSIIVKNPRPIEVYFVYSGFEAPDINMDKVCLYVPASSVAAYRAVDGWKNFKCIKDIASAPKEGQK